LVITPRRNHPSAAAPSDQSSFALRAERHESHLRVAGDPRRPGCTWRSSGVSSGRRKYRDTGLEQTAGAQVAADSRNRSGSCAAWTYLDGFRRPACKQRADAGLPRRGYRWRESRLRPASGLGVPAAGRGPLASTPGWRLSYRRWRTGTPTSAFLTA